LFELGGGVALLYATKALDNLQTKNEDERRGVQIIQNALKVIPSLHPFYIVVKALLSYRLFYFIFVDLILYLLHKALFCS